VAIWITVWIQGLFSGFVTVGRYVKWLTDINLLLHPVLHLYLFARLWDWYCNTGKTCLGGGMHCSSASSCFSFCSLLSWQSLFAEYLLLVGFSAIVYSLMTNVMITPTIFVLTAICTSPKWPFYFEWDVKILTQSNINSHFPGESEFAWPLQIFSTCSGREPLWVTDWHRFFKGQIDHLKATQMRHTHRVSRKCPTFGLL